MERVGANAKMLLDQLAKIRLMAKPVREDSYRCRCKDTGWIMRTEGTYDIGNGHRQTLVDATDAHPVAVRCERCKAKAPEPKGVQRGAQVFQ